jgi:hypothetical protein
MPLSPSDPRAGLDTVEKGEIFSPYLELNPTHPAHRLSLHQMSYPTSFFLIENKVKVSLSLCSIQHFMKLNGDNRQHYASASVSITHLCRDKLKYTCAVHKELCDQLNIQNINKLA